MATTAKADVSSVHAPASISNKKRAANRRNARKSTGPRTDAGKRVSSRNAVTHAIFCRDLLAGEEPRPELIELRESLQAALRPTDAVEHGLVDSIVAARWQLRRIRAAGKYLHEEVAMKVCLWGGERLLHMDYGLEESPAEARHRRRLYEALQEMKDPAAFRRPRGDANGGGDGADAEDDEARRERYTAALNDPLPLGLTMARDLSRGGGSAWDRLSRYEQRLEQNVARALRELRAYRKDLREPGRPDDAASIVDDEEEKAQNEPTADAPAASDGGAGGCNDAGRDTGVPPVRADHVAGTGGTPVSRQMGKEGSADAESSG